MNQTPAMLSYERDTERGMAKAMQSQHQIDTSWRGVIIASRDRESLNSGQTVLLKALQAAKIAVSFQPIIVKLPNEDGTLFQPRVVLFIAPQED